MYELLNKILDSIEYVSRNVASNIADITEKWDLCARMYVGIVDKINVIWRTPLDTELLEEFPDVRMKTAKKLERLENEQLAMMHVLIGHMSRVNECLKFKLDTINNILEQISFEDHIELKHSVREHVMWIEDCWTCSHCLYMQLDFALISLQVLNLESANNLVEAVKQDEKDKLILGKSQMYMQSCLSLLKFVENKSKIKITATNNNLC